MESEFVETLKGTAESVFAAHPVALAYLYGSRATGRYTRLSDVDVAIVTREALSPRERLRLELTLEPDLHDAVGEDFDVRVINDAPISVRGRVLQTGKRLYVAGDAVRIRFEEETRRLHFDFLPFLQRQQEEYFAARRADLGEDVPR